MHNGFVRINEEKMSKSLGNFFTVRDVLRVYKAEEIRYFIVSNHYRSQLNYSEQQLDNARSGLQRLYGALLDTEPTTTIPQGTKYQERFEEAMCDDFNTANAMAVLFELARDINRQKTGNPESANSLASLLRYLAAIIGLLQDDAEAYLKSRVGNSPGLTDQVIETMIGQRLDARKNKDWGEADRIRDELVEAGISIEDGTGGTRWRRA
jgi:cysteinyl-tRNA synthetase